MEDLFCVRMANSPDKRTHDGKFTKDPVECQRLIKNHLESGLEITVGICYRLFHTHDLRKSISRLRKTMTILDRWHMEGNRRCYKIYWLKKEEK